MLLLARYRRGLSLSELGAKMGGMDYASVSDEGRRYEGKLKEDRKAFEKLKKQLARG